LETRAVKDGKKDGKTYFFEMEQEVHEQKEWLEE
jgi:guanylate kinase